MIKNYLRQKLPYSWILFYHKLRGILAAFLYRFPGRRLKVIGVTGTNGKTTTCHMITKILEEAGHKVAAATTVNFKIGYRQRANLTKMTTISPFALQKFLREAVQAKCYWAVLETTSHAILQNRVWGIAYLAAVFTNLTHDHLDYHQSFEHYKRTKGKLFEKAKIGIINSDDKAASYFLSLPTAQKFTYAIENKADVSARKIFYEEGSSLFTAVTSEGQVAIDLSLPGRFNIYNALAALATGLALGVDLETCKKGLEKMRTVPGRMEEISEGQKFHVFVDYAHSPDALENIYKTISQVKKGRIISVLGATGDRDRTKRPIMGALAGRFADLVIVTNEDPYSEDAWEIIEQVAQGVPRGAHQDNPKIEGKNFWKILDRRQAILKALSLAKEDDIVLLTGKGAEEFMVVKDKRVPFSDRKVARELLQKIKK